MHDKLEGAPIGLQIRWLRKERGLTLEQLAALSGTSAPTLHRYEGGWDRFEIRTLEHIAQALDAGLRIRLVAEVWEPEEERTVAELVDVLAPLFWDRELRVSDLSEYPIWVLARVLMYGDHDQVRAARRFFGDDAIATAVEGRAVDPRTRNYWQVMLARS